MTAINTLYDPLRALLGDLNPTVQQFTDTALLAGVRLVISTGQVSGYALSEDRLGITPDFAQPRDLGCVLYRTALVFVAPNSARNSFRTRAFSESVGDQRILLTELHNVLHEMENPAMLTTWSNFGSWLTALTGLELFRHLTDMQTRAPIATAQISLAGITLSGKTQ